MFTHAIAFVPITVVAQRAHCHIHDIKTDQWQSIGRQKCSELHHRDEFQHNYYTFKSVHNGDHDGAVRIFVGLSYEWWSGVLLKDQKISAFFIPHQRETSKSRVV